MTNANELIHSFNDTDYTKGNFKGLTKREYFAAMALQAVIQRRGMLDKKEDVAVTCVEYADELIKALNENQC